MNCRGVKVWVATAICAQVVCLCAAEVRVIRAADYGARPDDGIRGIGVTSHRAVKSP